MIATIDFPLQSCSCLEEKRKLESFRCWGGSARGQSGVGGWVVVVVALMVAVGEGMTRSAFHCVLITQRAGPCTPCIDRGGSRSHIPGILTL